MSGHPSNPLIPTRTSSLAPTGCGRPEDHEPDPQLTRAARKRLRRSASTLNKFRQPEEWWNANDQLIRFDLQAAKDEYYETKRQYEEGILPKERWEYLAAKHLETSANLRAQLASIHAEKQELEAKLLQNYDLSPLPSKKFLSILLEFLEPREKRKSQKQTQFRKDLKTQYGAELEDESIFCPIMGYTNTSNIIAAHIFPFVLGTTIMSVLFGEDSAAEMFSPRNGLLLSAAIEEQFDKHRIVIVPAKDATL